MSIFNKLLLNVNSEPKDSQIITYTATKKLNISDRPICNSIVKTHEYDENSGDGTIICASNITHIEPGAFSGAIELKGISLPEGVTHIMYDAFYHCNLDTMILPSTIESIASQNATINELVVKDINTWFNISFSGYIFNEATLYDESYNKITEINVPDNVFSIKDYAFCRIKGLETININNVNEIGKCSFLNCTDLKIINTESNNDILVNYSAFSDCENLEEINTNGTINFSGASIFNNCKKLKKLPSLSTNITTIENSTFYNCESLETVVIPNSVNKIEGYAFYNCISLKDIELPHNITSISTKCFYNCSSLSEINLSNIITIYDGAFCNCINLTNIILNENINNIYSSAFENTGISSIYINVVKVNGRVFAKCNNLVSVEFGEKVKEILGGAFDSCNNLERVNIPNNVTTLNNCFSNCSKLKEVNVGSEVININYYTFDNSGDGELIINIDENNPNFYSENGIVFNKDKTVLYIYKIDKLQSEYIIPETVTTIDGAFNKCKYLTNVVLHDNISTIKSNSFSNCIFEELILPETLVSIEYNSISSCPNLLNINIPRKITKNVEDNFMYCHKLNINVNENNNVYTSIDGVLFDKEKTTLLRYSKDEIISNYEIPNIETLTTIGKGAFDECKYLTNIVIPNTITTIKLIAFQDSGLITINLPNSIKLIEESAFNACTNLESVRMNDCICTIEDDAFYQCPNLKSIHINSIEQWVQCNISDFDPFNIEAGLYINDTLVTEVILSGDYTISHNFMNYIYLNKINIDITNVALGAFYECYNLTDVNINCNIIYTNTFRSCNNLKNVSIGEKVSSIENDAFLGCTSLEKINITSLYNWCNMKNIDPSIIGNARGLYINNILLTGIVTTPDNISTIINNTFNYNNSITNIIFSEGVTEIENAFNNCENLEELDFPSTLVDAIDIRVWALPALKAIISRAKNCPSIHSNTFEDITPNGILYYPKGSDYSTWLNRLTNWTGIEVDFDNL